MSKEPATLEIDAPLAKCSRCGFTSGLKGTWLVEDGRLVFRAGADPQPRRGPDLESCCEGSDCGEFERIETWDGDRRFLTADEVTALRATARKAQEDEMRAWHEQESKQ